jgi:hypothetical protein
MCALWAQAIFDYAVKQGFHAPPCDMQHALEGPDMAQVNKTILGCLPRGRKVPPLLTDWLEPQLYNIEDVPAVQTLPVGKRIPDSVALFPPGSKLVRFTSESGVELELAPKLGGDSSLQLPKFAMVGIPHWFTHSCVRCR